VRALQQLGFDEWAAEVRATHEEFKQEAKSEYGGCRRDVGGQVGEGILTDGDAFTACKQFYAEDYVRFSVVWQGAKDVTS
jgi:hypothetical protein